MKQLPMKKRLVTRYAMQSAEAADENQRRVEAVFNELAAAKPDSEDRPPRGSVDQQAAEVVGAYITTIDSAALTVTVTDDFRVGPRSTS